MEGTISTGQTAFGVYLTSQELSVAPGQILSIPVLIHNNRTTEQSLTLSISGIPGNWVSVPSPLVHLAPGEQRETVLTVQPPAFPDGHAGRHSLVIRVASQQAPAEAVEKTCSLAVAALEVSGRIGVLLPATEFSVAPGGSTNIPLVLLNQGLDADTFALSVEGIPSAWIYAPVAAVFLAPGQQQEVTLIVQPPASAQTRAGRHPFRILVNSRGAPGQAASAACILTIASLTRFGSELQPQRVEAGQPARVVIENQGNVQQAFTVGWQSPGGDVVLPEEVQTVRVAPGEVGMVEFVARPRSRPFLGGSVSLPFTARIQAPDHQSRNLNGEVLTRGLLPGWVLPALLVMILGIIATVVLIAALGGRGPDVAPTQVPPTEAPPSVETDVPPTEAPPEATTEAPPEQPTEPPPEQPTEPPSEQPTEEPPEDGEAGGPGLPCLPAAFGLMLAPLLVKGKKNG